ncbi:hypothetical protein ACHAPT_009019 [Fusarium lateritium]
MSVIALSIFSVCDGNANACVSSSSKNEDSPSETQIACTKTASTEPSNTPYAPIPGDQVETLALECPGSKASKSFQATNGFEFTYYCNVDAPQDDKTGIKDMVGFRAYSIEDCLDACAVMTEFNTGTDFLCDSAVFDRAMSQSMDDHRGVNCWLKSGKKNRGSDSWVYNKPGMAYAELQTS